MFLDLKFGMVFYFIFSKPHYLSGIYRFDPSFEATFTHLDVLGPFELKICWKCFCIIHSSIFVIQWMLDKTVFKKMKMLGELYIKKRIFPE